MPAAACHPLRAAARHLMRATRHGWPRAAIPLLSALLVLLALLVAAAWFVPPMLDGSRYRASVAAYASSVLGREVQIDGDVALHLLPEALLAASRIRIADAGDGVAMTADQLRLSVSLGGLLAGRIDPRDLQLAHADLTLPWPFSPTSLARPPAWLAGLSVRLDDARVHLGRLEFTGVAGDYAPDPASFVRVAKFQGRFMGRTWRVQAQLGMPDADGAAGVRLGLEGAGSLVDTSAGFSGVLRADGTIDGQVNGHGPDLSLLVAAPKLAWRADGQLRIADGLAAADALSVQLGNAPAQGAVSLRLTPTPRLDLALSTSRLDAQAWASLFAAGPPPPALPGLVTGLDLSADSATLAGGTLRDVHVTLDLEAGRGVLRQATAVLPGEATLRLAGVLAGASGFDGDVALKLPDPRGTLRWLAPHLPGGPWQQALPRQAFLSGRLHTDAGGFTLDDASGQLDGSTFTGQVAVQQGTRPAITAHVSLDHLALDPLLPLAADWHGDPGWDAAVRLDTPVATLRGETIDHLVFDASEAAGGITLRSLQGGWRGVQAAASGTRAPDGRISDGKLLLVAADASLLRDLLPETWRGPAPLWQARLDTELDAAGPPGALATKIRLDLGDARLEAQPVIDLGARTASGPVTLRHPGAPRLLGLLGVPNAAEIIGTGSLAVIAQAYIQPNVLKFDHLDLIAADLRGSGDLTLDLTGQPALSGALHLADLPLPLLDPRDQTPLPLGALRGWQADLALSSDTVSLAGPVLGASLAHLGLANGVLHLDAVQAQLPGGGTLSGAASVDGAADPPAWSATAKIDGAKLSDGLFGLPVDLHSGQVGGEMAVKASGYSPAGLLATLAGTASLHATDATLDGLDLPALSLALQQPDPVRATAGIRAALAGGSSPVQTLDLGLSGKGDGLAQATGAFTSFSLTGTIGGSVDLAGRALDVGVKVQPVPGAPAFGIRLAGPLDKPTRALDLAPLAAWLATR